MNLRAVPVYRRMFKDECPDVGYKECFRLVLLYIAELELWQKLLYIEGEGGGGGGDIKMDSLYPQTN